MRFLLPIILLAVLLVGCSVGPASLLDGDTNGHNVVTVHMVWGAFDPPTVVINKGDEVCWVNEEAVDRLPAADPLDLYPEFDAKKAVRTGETWCFTFVKPGIWKYHDSIFTGLLGTVHVNE
jgi:plastocyanin